MDTELDTPRVYITSLADYNAGELRGRWFELDQYGDADELREAIAEMLGEFDAEYGTDDHGGPREEWAVHDGESLPPGYDSEHIDFEQLYLDLEVMAKLKDEELEAFSDYFDDFPTGQKDLADMLDSFRQNYQGKFDSERKYAEHEAEVRGLLKQMPESLHPYFDYTAYAKDLFSGGLWMSDKGHVFERY